MSEPIDMTQKSPRVPWNKGKLIGAKPPLGSKHVWSIRTRLQVEGRTRDLAMFNLAIDSKLRGCDVVATKVDDIAPPGYTAHVRQRKTGHQVRFELTDQTRKAILIWPTSPLGQQRQLCGSPANHFTTNIAWKQTQFEQLRQRAR